MAFLRLAENPRDVVAATGVLKLLDGIGSKTARKLAEVLARAGGDLDAWRDPARGSRVPRAAAAVWPELLSLFELLMRADPPWRPSVQVGAVRAFLAPFIECRYQDFEARLSDPEQLEWLADRYTDKRRFWRDRAPSTQLGCRGDGAAGPGGGLPRPFDDAFRQGA